MKKLIRANIRKNLKINEWEVITDKKELNNLYRLKVREELNEISNSNHEDLLEFADLLQVVIDYAQQNGFTQKDLFDASTKKRLEKGFYSNYALNNLNPNNPSNSIYFEQQ